MPAIYAPPILRILGRVICIPKRNAIVIRRIEKEHGCTLSRRDATRTKGSSHAPPLLAFHVMADIAGKYFRMTIPIRAAPTIARIVIILRLEFAMIYGVTIAFIWS